MHELGYTRDVVDTVVQAAQMSNAHEVRAVYLNIGEVRDIVDELFRKCFAYLSRDTIAKNSDVVIDRIPLVMCCRKCGRTFHADPYAGEVSCPHCGEKDYEILSGMEFSIDHIEVA